MKNKRVVIVASIIVGVFLIAAVMAQPSDKDPFKKIIMLLKDISGYVADISDNTQIIAEKECKWEKLNQELILQTGGVNLDNAKLIIPKDKTYSEVSITKILMFSTCAQTSCPLIVNGIQCDIIPHEFRGWFDLGNCIQYLNGGINDISSNQFHLFEQTLLELQVKTSNC